LVAEKWAGAGGVGDAVDESADLIARNGPMCRRESRDDGKVGDVSAPQRRREGQMSTDQETLPILVQIPAKGGRAVGVAAIPVATMRANLQSATALLAEVFSDVRQVGNYELSEVEVGVEITAEGGVQFIGTATVSGSGSITLKFKKP